MKKNQLIQEEQLKEKKSVMKEDEVEGKMEKLKGIKEKVIVGSIIKEGNGGMKKKISRIEKEREEMIIEESRKN